mmetsp:Transcript_10814/g.37683  ORF Transcript_10814/g.37683 Transcript_10814/m.37683 type:complete len:411 (-) Transcript_10814:134-1366(-)
MAVRHDDGLDELGRDQHVAQRLARVGRRVDHDTAPVDPQHVARRHAGGVEAVRRAQHRDAEDWRLERRRIRPAARGIYHGLKVVEAVADAPDDLTHLPHLVRAGDLLDAYLSLRRAISVGISLADLVLDERDATFVEVREAKQHVHGQRLVAKLAEVPHLLRQIRAQLSRHALVVVAARVQASGRRPKQRLLEHLADALLDLGAVHDEVHAALADEEIVVRRELELADVEALRRPKAAHDRVLWDHVVHRHGALERHVVLDGLWRDAKLDGTDRGVDDAPATRQTDDARIRVDGQPALLDGQQAVLLLQADAARTVLERRRRVGRAPAGPAAALAHIRRRAPGLGRAHRRVRGCRRARHDRRRGPVHGTPRLSGHHGLHGRPRGPLRFDQGRRKVARATSWCGGGRVIVS